MPQSENEFFGELRRMAPSRVIPQKKDSQIEDFFLILGLFFNDLKGFIFFQSEINKKRKPTKGEVSAHAGEYSGMSLQVSRFVSGIIHEFFNFVKEYRDVFSKQEFISLLEELNRYRRSDWKLIESIALERLSEDKFSKILLLTRNNITFHYKQAGKSLRNAFIEFFFNDKKNPLNEYAFYSIGENMEHSRFYYCDAIVETYIKSIIKQREPIEIYNREMGIVIGRLNSAILSLMSIYLKKRPPEKPFIKN